MDILQLRYFCHAASTLSFAKTAQAFWVPASNISQCIKRLEKELKVSLFIRSPNRIRLSAQGELFYKNVRDALELLDSGTRAIRNMDSNKCIRIAVAIRRVAMERIIKQFQAEYPDLQITYDIINNPAHGFSLDAYDLIIAGQSFDHPGYQRETLSHHKLYLFAAEGMLSARDITPEKLQQQVFVSHPPGTYTYQNTLRLCRDLNISPQILTQEKYSLYFIPCCIEERRGIAFASVSAFWPLRIGEYLDVFDVGEYYSDVYLYSKKEAVSPYMTSLSELIRGEYKRIQLEFFGPGNPIRTIIPTALSQKESASDGPPR